METNEYLNAILAEQSFSPNDSELQDLRDCRDAVQGVLRDKYGNEPRITEGGSKEKGTMIREAYDLDLRAFFPHESVSAGDTLEDIYNNHAETLSREYIVERRRSALRLHAVNDEGIKKDLHIDVVPGRYIDGSEGDVNLFQNAGEKRSLKTNPDTHVKHIRDSGVRPAIRLAKLWNVRENLGVKTFVLELLVVKLLTERKNSSLEGQLLFLFGEIAENIGISIEDPANPDGNDLSTVFDDAVKARLSDAATRALTVIEDQGWEALFGGLEDRDSNERTAALGEIAIAGGTKPWSSDEGYVA